MSTLRFALFGAGRIGTLHAANLAIGRGTALACVHDPDASRAAALAATHGARVAGSVEDALDACDAVLVASSTDTHVALVEAAARAGKPVLCEKPIDLDIARVEACRAVLDAHPVPVQIGFNRRYDPDHGALRTAVAAGEIGRLEMLLITSRDPAPPPPEYVRVSGGLFRDMAIHDLDMARFVLGEEPVSVYAAASNLVDPAIGAAGDVDTAMVVLRTASGALCHIDNSRRAVYGYDQRIEAFGATGMLRSENHAGGTVSRFDAARTASRPPLPRFFLERYRESYRLELEDFVAALRDGRPPAVGFDDGYRALLLARAAERSSAEGRAVAPW
ncbi:MAG: inositol 2-dehydrogenase [Ectothiorhodospiraceae bacterium]|nr:inositol 2-dehydrogenase [Ectothiorhodospiraceae bacterium]